MNKRHRHRRECFENAVAWRVNEWSEAVGCCRATTYNLIDAKEIHTAKVGTMRLILTSPAEYLARKAAETQPALRSIAAAAGRRAPKRHNPVVAAVEAAEPGAPAVAAAAEGGERAE